VKKGKARARCKAHTSVAAAFKSRYSALGSAPSAPVPSAHERAHAATLLKAGPVPTVYSPVVRLYLKGAGPGGTDLGWCSGTLVRRGVLLTAGHCLWHNDFAKHVGNWWVSANTCSMYAVPANNTGRTQPYGSWCVQNFWVPTPWASTVADPDQGYDWGLAYLPPESSGSYPGDYTGLWNAYWDAKFPLGSHVLKIGYPAEGYFAKEWEGNGQYYCENTWDGGRIDWGATRFTGYMMNVEPCPANGGVSGGPVLAYLSDVGEWGIVGVNNVGHRKPDAEKLCVDAGSVYFDDRFGEFWNAVLNEIASQGL
jgi:V8-like Glu-specific endopeptidase